MHAPVKISVVIPVLNEEESLRELASRLESVLDTIAMHAYEVLFIDDGSTDNSYRVLQELHQMNPRLHAIRFRRNYGKSAALAVGFARAEGEIVITMDADLQDDPQEIPALCAKLAEGYDLVSGWKKKRYDPWHKTLPSKLFNLVTSYMSGIRLHDFNCGLKAYRREVVKALTIYGDMHRYIPALAHWEGFRVTEIAVQHHPRRFGVSKFGAKRFMTGFLDLLTVLFTTKYVKRPLHLFGSIGTIMLLAGIGIEATLTVEWVLGKTYFSNRPLTLLGMLLIIVGVQLISMGLLGELLVKNSATGRTQYRIREQTQRRDHCSTE
ncbi:MAG: glycosyltransferase family 2 protein [Bacteroidota bacterium]|nr:glycosyltransferase family 2 protein [Candidatus Kapabacteria bacterium]MDW8220440.1 glycosyltransferase family 2 protein [Bacteroidota bacterium]